MKRYHAFDRHAIRDDLEDVMREWREGKRSES
jgi:hypothetical protein